MCYSEMAYKERFFIGEIALSELKSRCGEMADATDLKSVGLNRPVPVRIRPSALYITNLKCLPISLFSFQ